MIGSLLSSTCIGRRCDQRSDADTTLRKTMWYGQDVCRTFADSLINEFEFLGPSRDRFSRFTVTSNLEIYI
jgi:hypothetical protein